MSNRTPFHAQLVHELIELDNREAAQADRQGLRHSPYRIGLYLEAAQRVADAITEGATTEEAFTSSFVPTRGMHTVARHLGLALDVERGKWVAA